MSVGSTFDPPHGLSLTSALESMLSCAQQNARACSSSVFGPLCLLCYFSRFRVHLLDVPCDLPRAGGLPEQGAAAEAAGQRQQYRFWQPARRKAAGASQRCPQAAPPLQAAACQRGAITAPGWRRRRRQLSAIRPPPTARSNGTGARPGSSSRGARRRCAPQRAGSRCRGCGEADVAAGSWRRRLGPPRRPPGGYGHLFYVPAPQAEPAAACGGRQPQCGWRAMCHISKHELVRFGVSRLSMQWRLRLGLDRH
jgi:hypothetical protein